MKGSRTGQQENSNCDADETRLWPTLQGVVEWALLVQVSCLGLQWVGLYVSLAHPPLQAAACVRWLSTAKNRWGRCSCTPHVAANPCLKGDLSSASSLHHCLVMLHKLRWMPCLHLCWFGFFMLQVTLLVAIPTHSGKSLDYVNTSLEVECVSLN